MAFAVRGLRAIALIAAALALAGCEQQSGNYKALSPIPAKLVSEMSAKGMTKASPILVRAYKQESEIEVWKLSKSGRYELLKTYPVCRWSGQLGPKRGEGDRQVPEGFYTVRATAMNPQSRFYLSYDIGYPNAYDAAQGYHGGDIMVHGECSSRGCFAMTNEQIAEIYALTREAFAGGQEAMQFQSFPFRMTPENLAKHRKNPNMPFWTALKTGSDVFEVTKKPVPVLVCKGRYAFAGINAEACGQSPDPAVATAVATKARQDDQKVAALVAEGAPAYAVIYEDGSVHPKFAARGERGQRGRDYPYIQVSKPVEIALDARGAPANQAEARKAANATYAAANMLLMAEAALQRRPYKADAKAVQSRQQVVVARHFPNGMTPPAEPAALPDQPVMVAAAEEGTTPPSGAAANPAGVPSTTADASPPPQSESGGLFANLLSFAGNDVQQASAVKPLAPVGLQPAATTVMVKSDEAAQPFYRRWLGLGAAGADAAVIPATPAGNGFVSPAPIDPAFVVPRPPVDPRRATTASLPPEMTDGFLPGRGDYFAFAAE